MYVDWSLFGLYSILGGRVNRRIRTLWSILSSSSCGDCQLFWDRPDCFYWNIFVLRCMACIFLIRNLQHTNDHGWTEKLNYLRSSQLKLPVCRVKNQINSWEKILKNILTEIFTQFFSNRRKIFKFVYKDLNRKFKTRPNIIYQVFYTFSIIFYSCFIFFYFCHYHLNLIFK